MENARRDHLLGALGVSAGAEESYRRLAGLSPTPLSGFARQLGVDDATARARLDELVDLGLALPTADGWRALPLNRAAATLRMYRLAEIAAATEAAESLSALLEPEATPADGGSITAATGAEAVHTQLHRLVASAEHELTLLDLTPSLLRPRPTEASPLYAAALRGVAVRAVVAPPTSPLRSDAQPDEAEPSEPPLTAPQLAADASALVRIGPVALPLLLVDDRVAALPSESTGDGGTPVPRLLTIHDSRVAARLAELFDASWASAHPTSGPVPASGPPAAPDRIAALLSLLLSGCTDAVIAARLGVTERTVRRWVAELMEQHGVQTRLQLGAALARTQPPA